VGGSREGGRERGGVWCLVVVAGFGEEAAAGVGQSAKERQVQRRR
jgi:hypothetical protein